MQIRTKIKCVTVSVLRFFFGYRKTSDWFAYNSRWYGPHKNMRNFRYQKLNRFERFKKQKKTPSQIQSQRLSIFFYSRTSNKTEQRKIRVAVMVAFASIRRKYVLWRVSGVLLLLLLKFLIFFCTFAVLKIGNFN